VGDCKLTARRIISTETTNVFLVGRRKNTALVSDFYEEEV